MTAFTITLDPVGILTEEAFYQLCQANPEVKFECSAQGELMIMAPTGGESGRRNPDLTIDIGIWNRQSQRGYTLDSSTCFKRLNGAINHGTVVRMPAYWPYVVAKHNPIPPGAKGGIH
jgi:Uma2 family endonuclease